jgi:hypothetical protein
VQWIGRTYGIPPWRVDDKTSVKADLQHARSQLAGVVSEMLFDSDFCLGSSINEFAIARRHRTNGGNQAPARCAATVAGNTCFGCDDIESK